MYQEFTYEVKYQALLSNVTRYNKRQYGLKFCIIFLK